MRRPAATIALACVLVKDPVYAAPRLDAVLSERMRWGARL